MKGMKLLKYFRARSYTNNTGDERKNDGHGLIDIECSPERQGRECVRRRRGVRIDWRGKVGDIGRQKMPRKFREGNGETEAN